MSTQFHTDGDKWRVSMNPAPRVETTKIGFIFLIEIRRLSVKYTNDSWAFLNLFARSVYIKL